MQYRGLPVPVRPERLGVVIGKGGETKRAIEKAFNVKMLGDSNPSTGYLTPAEGGTPLGVMRAKQVVEAISLGFSPQDAMLLSDERYFFEVVDLGEVAKSRNDLRRIKARIIGEGGRAKRTIEQMSGTKIVVGDKVVGIIGEYENVEAARKAIEMLARGRTHATVYGFLRSVGRELKRKRLELWERRI
ncbi:MAG: RNA-processing protein [Thermoprotei archaeon]|nr:MAG: RNA-processing protein [Thermoprotei archaeon]